jgi:hypothetical protein
MEEKDLVAVFREERKNTGFINNPRNTSEENLEPSELGTVSKNIVIPDACLNCANLLPCVHTLITLIESRKTNPEKQSPVCKFL